MQTTVFFKGTNFIYLESELNFFCGISEVVAFPAVRPGQEILYQPDPDVVAHLLQLPVHVVHIFVVLEVNFINIYIFVIGEDAKEARGFDPGKPGLIFTSKAAQKMLNPGRLQALLSNKTPKL